MLKLKIMLNGEIHDYTNSFQYSSKLTHLRTRTQIPAVQFTTLKRTKITQRYESLTKGNMTTQFRYHTHLHNASTNGRHTSQRTVFVFTFSALTRGITVCTDAKWRETLPSPLQRRSVPGRENEAHLPHEDLWVPSLPSDPTHYWPPGEW